MKPTGIDIEMMYSFFQILWYVLRGEIRNVIVLQLSVGAILGKERGRRRRKWLEIGPQGEDLVLFIERCDFLYVS